MSATIDSALAGDTRWRGEPELLQLCAREPIHIPGAIQPHGFLLCLSTPDLTVLQFSENLVAFCALEKEELIDSQVETVIGMSGRALLLNALNTQNLDRPWYAGSVSVGRGRFDAIVHRRDHLLLLELECNDDEHLGSFAEMYPLVRSFMSRLQNADSIQQVGEFAAIEVQRITGFGRILVYRFDEQGHGQVLAECKGDDYDAFLGMRFPASDIPSQARALYLANHIRLIVDANYAPSPLVPLKNPVTGEATDLSLCGLRSVSPVHLQYMRNMGTAASMSISIIVQGQLWGLISGHHVKPRVLPFSVRTACEHLGQIVSLQVEAKEERSESLHSLELHRILVHLLASMGNADNLAEGLMGNPKELLGFAAATGAAVVAADNCLRVGDAPSEPAIRALADWLWAKAREGVYASNHLPSDYPASADLAPDRTTRIAGVMAIQISELHRHYVMWFRPEVVQTVRWAGNPEKAVQHSENPSHPSLHPRESFEVWSERVRGTSPIWRPSEIAAAENLRRAILAIVLRKAEELADLHDELQRTNKELEAFSYSVSHDLRAPLRHIAGYAELLRDLESEHLGERGRRYLQNIGESARFAGTLVDDLLSFSKMGRAALRIGAVDMDALVKAVIQELSEESSGRDIRWHVSALPVVPADSAFLKLAIRNVLSNAIKYSRTRQIALVSVEAEDQGDRWVIKIRDNGVGFDMKYADKLFGVFQRLHRMEDFEGTGIGLANVRRIVERHGGRVWAESQLDQGALFAISLPKTAFESL